MEGVAPPFAAVLFDLDGVLRNTEPYHRMAYAQDAVQIKQDGRKGRGYTFHLGLSMTAGLPSRSTTSVR